MTVQRSKILPIQQPDDYTCGPASLKLAAQMLGVRRSLRSLIALCKTNKNGTSTANMIHAMNALGFSVLAIEYATLRHIQSALRPTKSGGQRAILVSYLYDYDDVLDDDSGHWAVVQSYSASKGRLVILDSSTASKKSYRWQDFREQWYDYDLKRRYNRHRRRGKYFRLVKRWFPQLLLIVSKDTNDLPQFTISTKKIYTPIKTS